jgi:hypothetical protein
MKLKNGSLSLFFCFVLVLNIDLYIFDKERNFKKDKMKPYKTKLKSAKEREKSSRSIIVFKILILQYWDGMQVLYFYFI